MNALKRFFRDPAESRRKARFEHAKADRDRLKREYKALYAELAQAFFEVDPVGVNFDENTDEYELEVGTVLPRLKSAKSAADVYTILVEEFTFWFEGSFDPKRLAVLSERVWRIWTMHEHLPFSQGDIK